MKGNDFMQSKDTSFTTDTGNSLKTVLIAAAIAAIISVIAFLITGLLLTFTSLPQSSLEPLVFVVTLISVIIGGIISGKNAPKSGWIYGGAAAVLYFIAAFLISSAVNCKMIFNLHCLSMFATSVIGGCFGGILGINMKNKLRRY